MFTTRGKVGNLKVVLPSYLHNL